MVKQVLISNIAELILASDSVESGKRTWENYTFSPKMARFHVETMLDQERSESWTQES